MRIDEAHIYGFGQLRDVSYRFQDGLNVVEGLNEAGKTTLMAFIRGVLFGFESRRNPEQRYEPAEGGKFGGVLVLTDQAGTTYRVERVYRQKVAGDVTVLLPGGGEAGEALLSQLLSRMNENVFKNIFAFGLAELQQMNTLHDDEINHFIYTAGTGDGNVVREVQKELAEKEQALFRPNGSRAKINVKLQEIREAVHKLNQLRQDNEQYQQLVTQLLELDRQVEREEALADEWRRDISQLEKQLAHYDDCTRYVGLQDRLADLPEIESFPEDGVARLETLEKSVRDTGARIDELREKHDRLQKHLDTVDIRETLLRHRVDIEDLRDKLNSFRERKEQLERCLLNIKKEKQRASEVCGRLGLFWTESKIQATDTSVVAKQSVREFRAELSDLKADVSLAKSELDTARKEWQQRNAQFTDWQSREPHRPVKTERMLEEERSALEQAKELGQQLSERASRITTLREKIKEYDDTRDFYSQNADANKTSVWKWMLLGLTVVLPISLWIFAQPFTALVAFVLLTVLAVREFAKKAGVPSPHTGMMHTLAQKKEEAENELHGLQAESRDLQSQFKQICRRFGQEEGDVRRWEKQWNLHRESLRQWERWKEQKDEKEFAFKQACTVLQEVEQRLQRAQESHEKKRDEWKAWLLSEQWLSEENPDRNPNLLSPELVLEMMRDVEAAREAFHRVEGFESELEKHRQFITAYSEKLQTVRDCTDVQVTTTEPEFQVRELIDALEKAREESEREKALTEQRNDVEEQLRAAEHRLTVEKEELANLLRSGGAEDTEAFRLRAEQYSERKQLAQEADLLYKSFSRLIGDWDGNGEVQSECGDGNSQDGQGEERAIRDGQVLEHEAVNRFLAEMSRTSKLEIGDRLRSLQHKLAESHERCKQLRNERANLSVKIENLASGTDLSEQNMRCHQLVTDLQQDAKQWAVIALGRHLLQRAMQLYEREKQPGVLKQASRYLQQMTEGRYVQVLAPIGEQEIEVERDDGRRLKPAFLSRGTVEQLYLAMRFALVEEYGKQAQLPMVLDDIFVNFDLPRTRAAIRTLKTVAETRQVLFFTCHAHICALFEEERAGHHHIKLSASVPQLQ